MRSLRRIEQLLHAGNEGLLLVCKVLTIGLVLAITAVICAGVYYRYVLNDALSWSEEIAKFVFNGTRTTAKAFAPPVIDGFKEGLKGSEVL